MLALWPTLECTMFDSLACSDRCCLCSFPRVPLRSCSRLNCTLFACRAVWSLASVTDLPWTSLWSELSQWNFCRFNAFCVFSGSTAGGSSLYGHRSRIGGVPDFCGIWVDYLRFGGAHSNEDSDWFYYFLQSSLAWVVRWGFSWSGHGRELFTLRTALINSVSWINYHHSCEIIVCVRDWRCLLVWLLWVNFGFAEFAAFEPLGRNDASHAESFSEPRHQQHFRHGKRYVSRDGFCC